MGPRGKIRCAANATGSSDQIMEFPKAGAQLNLLRSCGASLRSAAVGIRRWGRFRDAETRAHLPPTEGGALAWSSFLGAGRSFRVYVARLEKACLLSGLGASWRTKAVDTADRGLAQAGDRSFSRRPAISRAQLCELVTSLSLRGELGLIGLIGWAFPPRIPSECHSPCPQRAGEDLDTEVRLHRRAAIGTSEGKLAIKLNRQRHMAAGSRLTRQGIFTDDPPDSLDLHIPQLPRPACHLWPAIRQMVSAGVPLFPTLSGEKVLSELRTFAGSKNWPRSAKLGAHSFRRGAARAVLEAGGPFSQLLRSGQRHSSAYRLYLDLRHEEADAMASALVEGSDDE